LWELTYDANFRALASSGQAQAQVRLATPFDTRHCQVIRGHENWIVTNPNLHAKVTRPLSSTGNRMMVFSTRQASTTPQEAKAKFVLRLSPRAGTERVALESLVSRDRFLRPEVDLPTTDPGIRQMTQLVPADAQTDFERLQWVFQFCSDIDSSDLEQQSDDAKVALTTKHASPKGRARAMATLCRALGFPARLATGFVIRQGANIDPTVWVEVFQNQEWLPFDPASGYSLNLPMNYVPVRRDADVVASTQNVADLIANFSIKRLPSDPRLTEAELQHPLQILNLRRLPLEMHTVMKILLLLPLAALITAILRNVVGLATFGTFSPSLLAMSFIYADLKTGLAILLVVVIVGLIGRGSLERLRLLTVPRLSIILTGVILCVVFGVSALHYSMPGIGAEVVLLPIVIMTNLIERFHVSADEDGLMFTIKLAVGTLVVAMLCYLVLGSEQVGNFVLTYPEAHFFTIAVFIVLGRYTGYRLTELWRFRDLVETGEPAR
jgi:7 transmembrane helices usually fused to an inactive transglutaminase/Transglutaminase-like superfamily